MPTNQKTWVRRSMVALTVVALVANPLAGLLFGVETWCYLTMKRI